MTDVIKPGDLVRVKPQYTHSGIFGVWVAEKMLTKNWELKRPADYTGMNAHKKLRAKPEQLMKADGLTAAQAAAGEGKVVMAEVNTFKIVPEGAIVHVDIPGGKIPAGLYVVTKGNVSGNPARVNIAELGGGSYWRVPVASVTVIPKGKFTIVR